MSKMIRHGGLSGHSEGLEDECKICLLHIKRELESQLAQAKAERDRLKKYLEEMDKECKYFYEQNAKYREVVESIAGQDCHKHDKHFGQKSCGECISCEARKVLGGGKND